MHALLLLALAAAPPHSLESLLENCRPAAIQGGGLWNCENLLASVSDVGGEVEAAARAHLAGMRASLKGEVQLAPTQLTVNGKTWPGYGFRVVQPPDDRLIFEGTLLAFRLGPVVRLVTCGTVAGTSASAKCPKILAGLAEQGPPASLKPGPNEKAKFVDRELETPKDCQLTERSETRFQLTCGQTAFLSYFHLPDVADLPKVANLMKSQLLSGVPGAKELPKARECKLGGVTTKCTVIEAADTVFFIASAVVKGTPVSVQCGQEKSRKGFHPVCATVLK